MAVTTMDLLELLRKADGADVGFLREGVRVLAQAPMDAEVSAQVGAEHRQRNPERTTHRNGYRARDWDARVGTIDLQVPRIREAATCLRSWSPAGGPSGPWPRSWPSATSRASPPGGWRTSPRPWGSPACPSPRSPAPAASWMSWSRPGATGPGRRPYAFVWLDALSVKVPAERGLRRPQPHRAHWRPNPEQGTLGSVLLDLLVVCAVAALVSLVLRFRRAGGWNASS
jgi:Transposase, Mutator family